MEKLVFHPDIAKARSTIGENKEINAIAEIKDDTSIQIPAWQLWDNF